MPDSALDPIPTFYPAVTGPPCPYTLVRQGSDPEVYVMDGSLTKRHVKTAAAFNACRYDWGDIVSVPYLGGYPTDPDDIEAPPCPYVRDPWYYEALMDGTLV